MSEATANPGPGSALDRLKARRLEQLPVLVEYELAKAGDRASSERAVNAEILPIKYAESKPAFPRGSHCVICDKLCDPAGCYAIFRGTEGSMVCSPECLEACCARREP